MPSSLRRAVAALTAGAFAVAGVAYWYWSPLIALHDLQLAAETRDADAFNRHVDYPRLRASLKGEFGAKVVAAMGGASGSDAGGAALGTRLGIAIADRLVDALVRPEVVMQVMEDGRLAGPGSRTTAPGNAGARPQVEWTVEREGVDRVVAYATRSGEGGTGKRVAFVLDRDGLAGWKLTGIRLPEDD